LAFKKIADDEIFFTDRQFYKNYAILHNDRLPEDFAVVELALQRSAVEL
jgi:hypothetical protein